MNSLRLSVPPENGTCDAGFVECKQEGCVEDYKVCDGTDDCGDGTDEEKCGEIMNLDIRDLLMICYSVHLVFTVHLILVLDCPLLVWSRNQ